MFKMSKRMEIASAHKLNLPYESPCCNLHGHNHIVTVYCASSKLNNEGMIVDFKHVKSEIHDKLDHHYLNDVLDCNPTAENIAKWVYDTMNNKDIFSCDAVCYKVEVQESEGNIAEYIDLSYFSDEEIQELMV